MFIKFKLLPDDIFSCLWELELELVLVDDELCRGLALLLFDELNDFSEFPDIDLSLEVDFTGSLAVRFLTTLARFLLLFNIFQLISCFRLACIF